MEWKKLLSPIRLGQEDRQGKYGSAARTGFQVDYDRVVFSPAFRRLQNKTQVVPLPKSDFVRNRLTHSLETASVGRSLGNHVGELILGRTPNLSKDYSFSDFGSLVSAACLAHDIGNPPFGHAGEDAISSYFKSDLAKPYIEGLSQAQKSDLQNFEGNAAGFRILTHTSPALSDVRGGLGLCYSTLASFVKYPRESYPDLKSTGKQHLKKFNFFQPETAYFSRIAEVLEIEKEIIGGSTTYKRYPLAFLMEASDDICYSIIDYEDGYQMGLIRFEEIEAAFIDIIGQKTLKAERYKQIHSKDMKIAYLRSMSINTLVKEAANCFMDNEAKILDGKFNASLLDSIDQSPLINRIKKESFQRIYTTEYILKIEAAGYKVLPGLLDFFISAIYSPENKFMSSLTKLIPSEYLDIDRQVFPEKYNNLLNIAMYVSSLTDQHAIGLFRDTNGISIPGI